MTALAKVLLVDDEREFVAIPLNEACCAIGRALARVRKLKQLGMKNEF